MEPTLMPSHSYLNELSNTTSQPVDSRLLESIGPEDLRRPAEIPLSFPALRHDPASTLLRYIRTMRHLEFVQIYSRLRPRPTILQQRVPAKVRPATSTWIAPIKRSSAQTGPGSFRFLNEERHITSWGDKDLPKLWLYNLHYFDHCDPVLARRWITENPVGDGVGWDPYPTSLRISNWCKWMLGNPGVATELSESLAVQAAWVYSAIETHLLANHLLANAKALMMAGTMLDTPESDRWYNRALEILHKEIPRQILSDGGHVERSPMYHSIVVEDFLDLINLASAYRRRVPELHECIGPMLSWLKNMTHPDGELSYFNDSVTGIAPNFAMLKAYANQLGVEERDTPLGGSGYVRLENQTTVVLFDAAVLGPEYQPGHGHADALSFELSHRGRRILANSGTSTYEANTVRTFERGTAAHNTIRIDDQDQSEMWSVFRVARRAHPFHVRTDGCSFVDACHDGYHRLASPVTHRRTLKLNSDSLIITDRLAGKGHHKAELFFHVAPDVMPEVMFDNKLSVSAAVASYATGWNMRRARYALVGRWQGSCPVEFLTRINLL
jgi:hypothetical protein